MSQTQTRFFVFMHTARDSRSRVMPVNRCSDNHGFRVANYLTVRLTGGNGFTLIELIITITVAAILAVIAVPSYRQFVESGRLTTSTNDFVGDISYARVESMKRGGGTSPPGCPAGGNGQVVVCASADGSTCATSPTTWNSGWIAYWNQDGLGNNYNAANCDAMLKIHNALPGNITAITTPAGTNKLTFNRIGSITTSITSLTFSDAYVNVNKNRVICLSGGTGRAMVAANNNVSSCP